MKLLKVDSCPILLEFAYLQQISTTVYIPHKYHIERLLVSGS